MRQRNDTGYSQHVSAWPTDKDPDRAPRDVAPREEIDFPELLAGFTSLEPEPAADAAEDAATDAQGTPVPAAKAKPRTKTTAAAPTGTEGGEAA